MTPHEASITIAVLTNTTVMSVNAFCSDVLQTRGGRLGSGMGMLLEALWGYYLNQEMSKEVCISQSCEMLWLPGYMYNDVACIMRDSKWDGDNDIDELLRVEAKSMNTDADESKGHFDELSQNLNDADLLPVLLWQWTPTDRGRVHPEISDYFVGSAKSIAILRDELHIARGGTFVDKNNCPDDCEPGECSHNGEPLNARGKRERISGPNSRRPGGVSYAANFGGLVRMLKTASPEARKAFRDARAQDETAHDYISFIHRNYPDEELNQYLRSEWDEIAKRLDIAVNGITKRDLVQSIREACPNYRDLLRSLD